MLGGLAAGDMFEKEALAYAFGTGAYEFTFETDD